MHSSPLEQKHKPRLRVLLGSCYLIIPTIALAHPGHDHGDEVDEFDPIISGLGMPLESLALFASLLATGWWLFSLSRRNRQV